MVIHNYLIIFKTLRYMFQVFRSLKGDSKNIFKFFLANKIDHFIDSKLNYRVFFWFFPNSKSCFFGFLKLKIKKNNFEVTQILNMF